MRLTRRAALAAFVLVVSASCKTPGGGSHSGVKDADPAAVVDFTVLQINDVYEIAPVESGRRGGIARVATLRQRLLQETPNVVTVLAGDFLSPSAMGATKVDGKLVAGAQMVDALNAMGLDLVTFGNHEFDLPDQTLIERIDQSQFKWISSNVKYAAGGEQKPFPKVERDARRTFANAQGAKVTVGFFGVTLEMVKKPFIQYEKPLTAAEVETDALEDDSQVIIALTHLSAAEDKEVAASVPRIDMLIGGHEHENAALVSGDDNTPIFKADANARTAYVHRFRYDTVQKKVSVDSKLVEIDEAIPEDPATAAVVKSWTEKVYKALRDAGVEPEEVVGKAAEPLEGFEAAVRNRPTNLTRLIGEAFLQSDPEADAAVFGGGSIRLDDRIAPGPITQFDVVRIFPFGGRNILVSIPGATLRKALEQGLKNKGSGGYLLWEGIARDEASGAWSVKGQPLKDETTYKLLFGDFLLTGQEKGLAFLSPDVGGEGVKKLHDAPEVRAALIQRLKQTL